MFLLNNIYNKTQDIVYFGSFSMKNTLFSVDTIEQQYQQKQQYNC